MKRETLQQKRVGQIDEKKDRGDNQAAHNAQLAIASQCQRAHPTQRSAPTNSTDKAEASFGSVKASAKLRIMASQLIFFLLILLSFAHYFSAGDDILLIADQHPRSTIKHLPPPIEQIIPQGSHFETNESNSIFRVLTAEFDRWSALDSLGDGAKLHIQRSNYFSNLTILLIQTDDDQMHPSDVALLYEIIRHSNAALAFLQLGEKEQTEMNKIVLSAANCTHQGKLKINIPHCVYFCNGIDGNRIPLYDPTMVVQMSTDNQQQHMRSAIGIFVSAVPQLHNSNKKPHDGQVHSHILKHRKKRISKLKLEQMAVRRKQAIMMARQKYLPNLAHLSMRKRRILCKYRKSCYFSGELPSYTTQRTVATETPEETCLAKERAKPEPPVQELDELALKVFCKYRKSCYDQIGAGHGKRKSAKRHRVLAGKSAPLAVKPKRKRTLKEMAEIALKHVDEQNKRAAQRPKPKMAIVKAKLNKLEKQRDQQLKCKYRKSCYESGIRPIVGRGENYFFEVFHFITRHVHTPGEETLTNLTFHDLDEQKKKLFCKYRKPCYDNGIKPTIHHEHTFKYQHMMEKHEAEIPLQIKCHYRKSCYETGRIPELRWSKSSKAQEQTELSSKNEPRTVAELKLRCKYKKSCYLQHAIEQAHLEQAAKQRQQERVIKEVTDDAFDASIKEKEKEVEKSDTKEKLEQQDVESPSVISETAQKTVLKKRRTKVKEKPLEEAQPVAHEHEITPPHERLSKKYHIIPSENETHTVRQRQRRIKHHLEQIVIQRKQARLMAKRKHTVLTQLSITRRKLLCKYRKSCYETGIPPMFIAKTPEPCKDEQKEFNELELKVFCKYRKSCYDEIGTGYQKQSSGKRHLVLGGKGTPLAVKPRKKRSVKEMAKIALEHVSKKQKRAAQRRRTKMEIVKAKLNKMDQDKQRKLECKYRKSCYQTGIRPIIQYDNYLVNAYHFLTRHVHTPGDETLLFNRTFAELDDNQKKLFCKYRKPCYTTGVKPHIEHEERFKYKHVIEKHELEIPLEIKCHYRKSCYQTGIVPDLGGRRAAAEIQQSIKKAPETIAELKLHCKYRKSCYLNKTTEQPEAEITQHPLPEEKRRIVIPSAKLAKKKLKPEVKPETIEEPSKAQVPTKEHYIDKVRTADEKYAAKKKEEEVVPDIVIAEKIVKPKPIRKSAGEASEGMKQKTAVKEKKKAVGTEPPIIQTARKAKQPEKKETVKKLDAVSEQPEPKLTRKEKTVERKEQKKDIDTVSKQPVSKAKRKEEKVTESKEPKKAKLQKPTTPIKEEKPTIIRPVTKDKPTITTSKPTETAPTKPVPPKAKEEVEEEFVKKKQKRREVEKKEKKKKEDEKEGKKEDEKKEEKRTVEEEKQTVLIKKAAKIPGKISISVPHKEVRYQPPAAPSQPSPELEIPPIKMVHIEGEVGTLEEKLRCKYRKSCYHNRTLPHPFEGFKIHHIIKKEDQHLPIQYRCKYRKSCYETGELPRIGENFKVEHLIVKKEEHIPISLRCKYRKSCYETGQVPQIDQRIFIVASIQNFLREFYEETEEIRREMSEEERKLSCKYRKSCYATGKLPLIEGETMKTIADTMKEAQISLHLRCKYRKSCYANYGIPIAKSSKRISRPEAVIEKPVSIVRKAQVKVKSTEERKPQPPTSAEEAEERSTKKGKKSEKAERIESEKEDELEYMELVPDQQKQQALQQRPLTPKQKLKCKYRLMCYNGVPIHKIMHELRKEPISIKKFQRADGRPCTIYHLSCRRMAGLPIKERAPIGPNGRRLCRKKAKVEATAK